MTSAAADVIRTFTAAISKPDPESLAALDAALAEGVEVVGIVGGGSGKAGVLEALGAPNATRLLEAASWSEPVLEGGEWVVDAKLPSAMPLGGIRFALRLDDDQRIARVEEELLPAAPVPPSLLRIDAAMKEIIDGALANGTPVLVSYVDAENAPHTSPRGSVQVFGDDQLAIWVRDPQGGLLKGIAGNPRVALYYRDPKTRFTYTLAGRARVVTDPTTRDRVYANTAEIERRLDGRKRGVAVVVDLDSIEGNGPDGRVRMRRE